MNYCITTVETKLKNRKRDEWWNSDLREDMTCTCPTLQMTLQWLRKKYNLMCVCLPYATTEGIFYAYKIFYLDHKQLGYFTKKEKSGFDDPKSAYEEAIRYCLENLIDIPEENKDNKS